MKRYFWSEKWKYVIAILSVLKCWLLLQNVIYPKPRIEPANLSHKLENIYDLSSETFSILDLKNISFSLKPRGSCEKAKIVLMVLSAPKNIQKREKLREQFRKAIHYQIQYHKSAVIVVTKLSYFSKNVRDRFPRRSVLNNLDLRSLYTIKLKYLENKFSCLS